MFGALNTFSNALFPVSRTQRFYCLFFRLKKKNLQRFKQKRCPDSRMDQKRCLVEVLGVPDLLDDEITFDKLLIYFLRKKNGGGEVLKVLYPCYLPGQAFVTFEQPEGQ